MKKILIALCILFVGFNVQAQETDAEKQARTMELMSKKVEMDIDTELFMNVTTNTYVSESPKVVIMAMMVAETYANSKKKLNEDNSDKFKVTERGEKKINGVNVLYMKGTSEAEGTTLNNTIYCVEYDATTCIMFVGMVEDGADKKYADAIDKAANSIVKKH